MQTEYIDDAEAYLTNQLSVQERLAFEHRLTQSPALREALLVQQVQHDGMVMLAIEQQLKEISLRERHDRQLEKETYTYIRPLAWGRIAVAAAIGLTLLAGGGYWWQQTLTSPGTDSLPVAISPPVRSVPPAQPVNPKLTARPETAPNRDPAPVADRQLFTAYFRPEPNVSPTYILRAEDEADGGYTDDSLTVVKDSLAVRAGIRLLTLHRPADALTVFRRVTLPGHWRACAEWYTAMAYLQQNQTRPARSLVRRIASSNGHPYQRESARLLDDLGVLHPKT